MCCTLKRSYAEILLETTDIAVFQTAQREGTVKHVPTTVEMAVGGRTLPRVTESVARVTVDLTSGKHLCVVVRQQNMLQQALFCLCISQ